MCASGGRAEIRPFFLSLNPWNKTKHFVHDPHYIKLQVYKQVPRWWYLCILVVAFAMAQATNYTGESGLPWWALIVFIIFAFFLCCFYATLAAILGFYQFSSGGTGFFQVRPSLWCCDGQVLTTFLFISSTDALLLLRAWKAYRQHVRTSVFSVAGR